MDQQIGLRFDRVEKALATLIDSISKYNPSTSQGSDLVAADTALSKGLEECTPPSSPHLALPRTPFLPLSLSRARVCLITCRRPTAD